MQYYLTTTGTKSLVTIADLGELEFQHPQVNTPLLLPEGGLTYEEYVGSVDFQAAVDAGEITISDQDGNNVDNPSEGFVFGQNFHRASKTSSQSTTSSSYVNYLTLTTSNVPAGTYRIGWSSVFRQSSTSRDYSARVHVDNSINIIDPNNGGEIQVEPKDSGSDQRIPAAGFGYVTFATSGSHTIDYDFREQSGSTAYTYSAHLEFWRVS